MFAFVSVYPDATLLALLMSPRRLNGSTLLSISRAHRGERTFLERYSPLRSIATTANTNAKYRHPLAFTFKPTSGDLKTRSSKTYTMSATPTIQKPATGSGEPAKSQAQTWTPAPMTYNDGPLVWVRQTFSDTQPLFCAFGGQLIPD